MKSKFDWAAAVKASLWRRHRWSSVFAALLAVAPCHLRAESTDSTGAAPAEDRTTGLQEIVVTAQKRSESEQNVPLAISVLGSDQLERLGIGSIQDLASWIHPSFPSEGDPIRR